MFSRALAAMLLRMWSQHCWPPTRTPYGVTCQSVSAPVQEMRTCRTQHRGGFRASLLIELSLRSIYISTTA